MYKLLLTITLINMRMPIYSDLLNLDGLLTLLRNKDSFYILPCILNPSISSQILVCASTYILLF